MCCCCKNSRHCRPVLVCAQGPWSTVGARAVLTHHIEAQFAQAERAKRYELPRTVSHRAIRSGGADASKDPYNFDFLTLGSEAANVISNWVCWIHIQKFLLRNSAWVRVSWDGQFHLGDWRQGIITSTCVLSSAACVGYMVIDLKMKAFEPRSSRAR